MHNQSYKIRREAHSTVIIVLNTANSQDHMLLYIHFDDASRGDVLSVIKLH